MADPTADMFSLDSTSMAADRGVASVDGLSLPPDDFFGAARDPRPDIGAIER